MLWTTILICIIILLISIITFFTKPISFIFFNTDSLPMYLASKNALKMLNLDNNKENRQYIKNICCIDNRFNDDFIKYANSTFQIIDINMLGILIYEYVTMHSKH